MAESWFLILSCFVAGFVGILTIFYKTFQWRRNVNISWMNAIARSKKNPKAKYKVPVAHHTWTLEPVSRGKSLNYCVCLQSMSPSQTLGPMVASESFFNCCNTCGTAAHLSCSSSAHKDCKCVSMFGYKHVVHQWEVWLTEVADQPDESCFCSYCEEPCSSSFLGGSPVWCCLWCRCLVHVDFHANMFNETGDICYLGPFRRLILSPLQIKKLTRTSSSGLLSSITQGANEIASSMRASIRSQSKKYKHKHNNKKHGNEVSTDTGNGDIIGDTTTESTTDTYQVNGTYSVEENCNGGIQREGVDQQQGSVLKAGIYTQLQEEFFNQSEE